MPAVEEFGVEAIPAELQTVGRRDLFAINFTFFLNPVVCLLGAGLGAGAVFYPLLVAAGRAIGRPPAAAASPARR